MTFQWLLGIVGAAAVSMWTIDFLLSDNPRLKGILQSLTVIAALAFMVGSFLCGLH